MLRQNAKLVSVLTLAAALTACSSDSDDNSGGGTTVTTTAVSGTATKGIIIGGVATAYPLVNGVPDTSNPLGSATTDANGQYSIELPSDYDGGPIVVTVKPATDGSTTMRCDIPSGCGGSVAFGSDYTLTSSSGFSMSAIVATATSGETITVNPTPLTEVATQLALQAMASASELNEFTIQDAISDANSSTADRFGITGTLNEQPVIDVTDPDAVAAALSDPEIGADGVRYNALAGAIIEATLDDNTSLSVEQALDQFADNYVNNGGIAGNTTIEGTTSLEEILTAAGEVLSETTEQEGGSELNLTEVTTELATDTAAAGEETPDQANAGNPSETAADGELSQVKSMISDLRDIGGSVSVELENSAQAFADEIELAAVATEDATAAAMEALGEAAEALAEAIDAYSDDDGLTTFTAENGIVVTFSTPEVSATAAETLTVTASVDQSVTTSGVAHDVDLAASVDVSIDESETGTETPDWPAPGTNDSGTWAFSLDGDIDFSLSGTVTNSAVELAITEGSVNVAVALDESEDWSQVADTNGTVDVDESSEVDASVSFSFDLNVTLTQVGSEQPVSFEGDLGFSIQGVDLSESETWARDETQGESTFAWSETETWSSTTTFDSIAVTLSGTFAKASQSFQASFALNASGNGVTFSDMGSWENGYSNDTGWTSSETNESSDDETADNYVDMSMSLSFIATLTGISDAVSVQFSATRTGLEAADASLDLAWDGHRLDIDVAGSDSGGSATVSNQDGVVMSLTESGDVLAGTITNGGTQYATINDDGVIRYVDETFESF